MTWDSRVALDIAEELEEDITPSSNARHVIAPQLLREAIELTGPTCPFDGRPAIHHFAGRGDHLHNWPRSFKAPTPLVKHEYEECLDCDALSSYHHEGYEHCVHCSESPDVCDGTPLTGGNVPSHDDWPEGVDWWKRMIAAGSDGR